MIIAREGLSSNNILHLLACFCNMNIRKEGVEDLILGQIQGMTDETEKQDAMAKYKQGLSWERCQRLQYL